MIFRWFCKQKSETYQVDPDKVDELLYENGYQIGEEKLSQSVIDFNRDNMSETFQKGGCFGTGPGDNDVLICLHLSYILRTY